MSSSEPMGNPSILRNSGSFSFSRRFLEKMLPPLLVVREGHSQTFHRAAVIRLWLTTEKLIHDYALFCLRIFSALIHTTVSAPNARPCRDRRGEANPCPASSLNDI